VPPASDLNSVLRGWEARDWAELSAVWSALMPAVEGQKPLFQGEELTAQQAGYLFERWVIEAFRLSGMKCTHSFRIPRQEGNLTLEEIDGLVYDGWQGFLVECKFKVESGDKIDIDPIFRLHLMTEQRPVGTMGLFFAASGYTAPALELVDRLRPIRVLLFDQEDLDWAVQSPGSMMQMVRRKWILAVKNGRPYFAEIPNPELSGETPPHASF
jgi:hypothetical protein